MKAVLHLPRGALILTALVLPLLTGCKTADVATGFAKEKITRVEVDPKVPAYGGIRLGPNTGGQPLSVGLANLIVGKMYAKEVAAIEQSMTEMRIDLSKMVYDRFAAHLRSRNLVEINLTNSQAVIQLEITQYGFAESPVFSGNDVPFLELRARLVNKSGAVLWKATALMATRGYKGMGGSLADYARDKEKLKKDWETQVERIVEYLLAPRK